MASMKLSETIRRYVEAKRREREASRERADLESAVCGMVMAATGKQLDETGVQVAGYSLSKPSYGSVNVTEVITVNDIEVDASEFPALDAVDAS